MGNASKFSSFDLCVSLFLWALRTEATHNMRFQTTYGVGCFVRNSKSRHLPCLNLKLQGQESIEKSHGWDVCGNQILAICIWWVLCRCWKNNNLCNTTLTKSKNVGYLLGTEKEKNGNINILNGLCFLTIILTHYRLLDLALWYLCVHTHTYTCFQLASV